MKSEKLRKHQIFSHFYSICQIPHGSGNEEALSRFLAERAVQMGYEVATDDAFNVVIRVPASEGYESRPAVMLQAHMDMVCEKISASKHDFEADPIPWVVEDDLLTTGGETTLGADNGIGIALAMALMEEKDWAHPRMEIVFTTNEEEDFSGAETLQKEQLTARYLINLDHVREGEAVCGSCGGMRADLRVPLVMQEAAPDSEYFTIVISGLTGGHSGEDIHRGRGNANSLMGRLLDRLHRECSGLLTELTGGSFRLAIPREASFTIALPKGQELTARKVLEEMEQAFRRELALSGSSLKITMEPVKGFCSKKTGACPEKVITAIALIPDGIYQMNEAFEGIVDTSDNLGELYLEDGVLHAVLEIRSATESLRSWLYRKMELLAGGLGGTVSCQDVYPGWDFHAGSTLQKLCREVYREQTGKNMKFLTLHAGLEVGYFLEKHPDLDAVSIGPDIRDFHSPYERVSISSVERVCEYLKQLIGRI